MGGNTLSYTFLSFSFTNPSPNPSPEGEDDSVFYLEICFLGETGKAWGGGGGCVKAGRG